MSNSALHNSIQQNFNTFDREDWASAYRNVEKELTNAELTLFQGSIPNSRCDLLEPQRIGGGGEWTGGSQRARRQPYVALAKSGGTSRIHSEEAKSMLFV